MKAAESETRSVTPLCRLLGHTKQAYYKWKAREERFILCAGLLLREVANIRGDQKRLGARKLHYITSGFRAEHNMEMGRDAFFDLLRTQRLLVRKRRARKPRTTLSMHWLRRYPNLIREFVPAAANELWVSDITYISVGKGFCYLSLVTDAYSRKIVGYHLSEDLSAKGPVTALKAALADNPDRGALIHHSDRGLQYCSAGYVDLLAPPVRISMTECGDPRENAIAERINGILKDELLDGCYASFRQARIEIARAVSVYNFRRPHLSIDMLTPDEAHSRSGELKRRWKNYYPINSSTGGKTEAAQAVAYATA